MKFNPQLKQEIERYKDYVILVEGQKDVSSLKACGFDKVYQIHKTSVSLRERIEEIAKQIDKKEKVCILTDFDRKGKEIYMKTKAILQELGIKLDSSLRGLLLKAKVSHVEGIHTFMKKVEGIY
ncbi:toprim domain-containing protein [Candidatus Pacearchaeota archaeon]|nr:toprim domain-containing protein [Candidatus Pacearchaeota archaeon]